MPNARLKYLFDLHLAKTCTEAEKQELAVMILSSKYEGDIQDLLQQAWDNASGAEDMEEEKVDHIIRSILASPASPPAPLVKERGAIVRRLWKKIAAAAAVLLLASVGSYFIFKNKENQDLVKAEPQEKRFKNDIAAPTKQKATITLADGSAVALDSVTYGKLATQGNVNVMVTADGRLVYKVLRQAQGDIQYNTLNNPRGSKVVDITLVDGSRVWLNAGSSLTYPVAFVGNERKVSITGEAYFEVKHNAAMPFKVTKGEVEVTDIGTSFNVNAYDDEANIKVTLLEGSVKVSKSIVNSSESVIVKPGEQVSIGNSLKILQGVDTDEVMAWKNGKFYFDGTDIKTMMRQLERWYNVEVEYKADIKSSFVAKISRDEPVTGLLKILELTNLVHFKIEGNKIEVIK